MFSEHLYVLLIIIAFAITTFAAARAIFVPALISGRDFNIRTLTWLAVATVWFLAHDFWIALLLSATIIFFASRRDSSPICLYASIILVVPWYQKSIPAFGIAERIIDLNYSSILALIILLPYALQHHRKAFDNRKKLDYIDLSIVLWLLYKAASNYPYTSWTNTIRILIDNSIGIFIPYLAFRYGVGTTKTFRELAISFVVGAAPLALLAIYESEKGWLIYESLRRPLGIPPEILPTYFERHGAVRAMTSLNHPIVFGFYMMIVLMLAVYASESYRSKLTKIIIFTPFLFGMMFSFSRGPWVGGAVALILYVLLSKIPSSKAIYFFGGIISILILGSMLDIGGLVYGLLGIISSIDSGPIDYRAQLLKNGLLVFMEAPIFGSKTFLTNSLMEELRQGQGIIDLVNSYLAIALAYGGVGLLLFLFPVLVSLSRLTQFILSARRGARLGAVNVLLSIQIAILITIATVSSIGCIPLMIYIFTGTALGIVEKSNLTNDRLEI